MLIAATFFIIFGILGVQVKICKAITVTSTCNILHCHFIKDSVFMRGSLMTVCIYSPSAYDSNRSRHTRYQLTSNIYRPV